MAILVPTSTVFVNLINSPTLARDALRKSRLIKVLNNIFREEKPHDSPCGH